MRTTVLAVKQYDRLLREPCFVCSVQTARSGIKPEVKTLPCSEKVVRDYYMRIYRSVDIYYSYTDKIRHIYTHR